MILRNKHNFLIHSYAINRFSSFISFKIPAFFKPFDKTEPRDFTMMAELLASPVSRQPISDVAARRTREDGSRLY